MPVGVHRQPVSRWHSVLPFLAVLVLVPLLALGANKLLTGGALENDKSQSGTSTPTTTAQSDSTPTDQPQSTPAAEPTPEPAPEPTPEPTPEAVVNHDAQISVLNAGSVQGLAAEKVAILTAAGFTTVSAANNDGWVTEISTVYYPSEDLKSTAENVAQSLGIADVKENATDVPAGQIIVVVH